ncbi:MAG: hypothetical protein A4E53_01559 [Pelotomaculum sp. PtaB.Bin104]|nr:MAG: hypothetical protein A4E53_01559 [Pelotomaculum sp. PtaB.Bin104]
MKQYRVRFKLPKEIAGIFDFVEDKSDFVSRAIEWYISYGRESLERLKKIEAMLAGGICMTTRNRVESVQKDEIDDAFDDFVL